MRFCIAIFFFLASICVGDITAYAGQNSLHAKEESATCNQNDIALELDRAQLPEIRKAAESGSAQEQYILGCFYMTGIGVQKNPAEAVQWWSKAASHGYAEAQAFLGSAYMQGSGVGKDAATGAAWLRKAADQGLKEA